MPSPVLTAFLKQLSAVKATPTIAQDVDLLFKGLDTNHDALIGKAELAAKLPANADPIVKLLAGAAFRTLDADHDGNLSKAEALAWAGRLDANHDGKLDLGELSATLVTLVGLPLPLHG
jgi:Ca2+-binding EF-hand superfamily protein